MLCRKQITSNKERRKSKKKSNKKSKMMNIFGIGERNQNMVIFVFNVVITIAATAFGIFIVA